MGFKKRTKSSRHAGRQTAGRGAKERTRGSGNRGGKGMAGTGKRGDQKKTFVIKLTGGNNYFGKDKTLRAGRKAKALHVLNLGELALRFPGQKEIKLSGYKLLGEGTCPEKITIHASAASASTQEKIKKAGSTLVLSKSLSSDDKK